MEALKQKFLEEASELLVSLESGLLNLDKDRENTEYVNQVFRVMHSLKGSGAMFGYNVLSAFAHELESIYDLVREKKLKVTRTLIDATFDSIDIFRVLLMDDEDISEDTIAQKDKMLEYFNAIAAGKVVDERDKDSSVRSESAISEAVKAAAEPKTIPTWRIHFEPSRDVMKDGSNPLYMIDELRELGQLKVFLTADKIPPIEELKPDESYVLWNMLLVTKFSEDEIKDVFLFVEDESNIVIEKIADFDILNHPKSETLLQSFSDYEYFSEKEFKKVLAEINTVDDASQEELSVVENQLIKQDESYKHKTVERKIESPALTTIRVSSFKLDKLMDLVSEVITTQARLEHYNEMEPNPELGAITEAYQKLSRQLRENVLDMRLIPVNNLLHPFRKLIRDLSNEYDKEIEFVTRGTDTELDKSIIEKLTDPIMHIIRNSFDHGIESKEERIKKGKPAKGEILFEAYYSGASIVINISDDGAGLNLDKIHQKAVAKGIIRDNAELTNRELSHLIFHPGFTTNEEVTDISGRGVGMDVVKKNIEELRGEIDLLSTPGKGTTIRITLPLTLSIIDGLLVYINKVRYIVQMDNIKRIYKVTGEEVAACLDNVIIKEGKQIPFINLTEQFSDNGESPEPPHYMLVIYHDTLEVGLLINKIVGKYQAVIKPLGKYLRKMDIFSGASILGDGSIAIVMDVNKIILNLQK
ncbi:MAG: chemotaxis protein CheA [Bacteroidetes bacterium]|nr:MAG: chemotaxis protein CheA [Bacteroidota bacterium]